MQTTTNRQRAFTLVDLLLIVLLMMVLAAMLLPALVASKKKASQVSCANNLEQVDLAFMIWAHENDDQGPMAVPVKKGGAKEFAEQGIAFRIFQVMSNEINAPQILHCPNDMTTVGATNFINLHNRNLSYFIGMDATKDNPQAILLGDDNLVVDGKPVLPGLLNLSTNHFVEWGAGRHHHAGNIALTDGSAQQATGASLRTLVSNAAIATNINRLVIP